MLFLFVLLYLAAIYLRPGELFPVISAIPVVDLLSLGSLAAAAPSLMMKPRSFWDQPHDKFFLGYYIIIVLSNPLSGYFGGGQLALTSFAPVVFTYFLIRVGIDSLQKIRIATRVLLVLTLFLAFNGLLQIFAGVGIGGVEAKATREGARIMGTGIFADANDLGMAMVMVVPFALSMILGRGNGFFTRLFSLTALGTLVLACYYTNSRGTVLGLGVVFSIYAFRRFGLFTAATLSGVGLAAIIIFGPSRTSQISAEDASSQGRIHAWSAAFQMLKQSPIWGVGWGRFIEHHERAAHNSFMHATGELGLVGAMMLVGMFYWYFLGLKMKPLPDAGGTGAEAARGQPPPARAAPARASLAPALAGASQLAKVPTPVKRSVSLPPSQSPYARRRQPAAAQPEDTLAHRVARDLSDCAIGVLTCTAFLSRQYTVIVFIPLALAACFAATQMPKVRDPKESDVVWHTSAIGVLTCAGMVVLYVAVRVLARYSS